MAELWEAPPLEGESVFMEDRRGRYQQAIVADLDGTWNTCPVDNSKHYSCNVLPGVQDNGQPVT
mgnify:CR=1 FL=1